MTSTVDEALRQAAMFAKAGQPGQAMLICRQILQHFPAHEQVLQAMRILSAPQPGNPPDPEVQALAALYGQGRAQDVIARTAALAPRYPQASVLSELAGAANMQLGRLDAALACFDRLIALNPAVAASHYNRGVILDRLKRCEEAVASYDEALRLNPHHAEAFNNRGNSLGTLGRFDEAVTSFDRSLQLKPGDAATHFNRGNALRDLHRRDEALASYETALRLKPDHVGALCNRGQLLKDERRFDAALASLDLALGQDPALVDARIVRGNVMKELKQFDEALADYGEALRIDPNHAQAHHNRGLVLTELRRLDEAVASLEAAVRASPDYTAALSQLLYQRANICDWSELPVAVDLSRLGIDGDAVAPFAMLALDDDPARQLGRARRAWKAQYRVVPLPDFAPQARRERIRIGYFSSDFHDHATMYLMAGLFEAHDRSRFDVHAYSYGVDRDDAMRRRLLGAVEHFTDLGGRSDVEAARLARADGIDIAVDLKGFTLDTRLGIFAHRAAPIQISYLGYPGTLGTELIDYVIGDPIVTPPSDRRHYVEKIIALPGSYQVNDDRRPISERRFARSELGLPDDGFVFCCFNNNYKISPAEFDIWMRLLRQVEGSVLWLFSANPWAEANLRREAAARGVAPERIVFAARMALPDHLARHRCADLFLDTFAYNAHTTASDALWAGLPLVTRLGRSFPGRVGASLLHAVGLPELITYSPEAYERLALDLATDRDRLAAIRTKLAGSLPTAPLFDTARFARHLERAYAIAWDRRLDGLPPDHIEPGAFAEQG
jgi:predicted O-linked N-acetylglucosamine transferase (SPINDLY family)